MEAEKEEDGKMMTTCKRTNSEFGAWTTTAARCPSVLTTASGSTGSNAGDTSAPLHYPVTSPPVSPALPPIYQRQPADPLVPEFAMASRKTPYKSSPCHSHPHLLSHSSHSHSNSPHSHPHHVQCTRRYSKIDDFIDGLDAACETLPTPLIGGASSSPPPCTRSQLPNPSPMSRSRGGGRKEVSFSPLQPPPPYAAAMKKAKKVQTQPPSLWPSYRRTRTPSSVDDLVPISKAMAASKSKKKRGVKKEVKFADHVTEIDERRSASSGAGAAAATSSSGGSNTALGELSHTFWSRRNPIDPAVLKMDLTPSISTRGAGSECSWRFGSRYIRAATMLQSTYRGYRVRKMQPLKSLLAICGVKAKLEERMHQFEAWKIAAWFPTDFTERVTMTQGLTDLLGQLDALQNAPHVVKDFRNSVRREVLKFQEEVEYFLCQNSKHGVLFDLTQPEGNTLDTTSTQRPRHPKLPTKAIKRTAGPSSEIPSVLEHGNSNDLRHCRRGNRRETTSSGFASSNHPPFKIEDHFQIRLTRARPKGSSLPQCDTSGRPAKSHAVPSWHSKENPPRSSSCCMEKVPQTITELKKCVAPFSNFDIYTPPKNKHRPYGVRFSNRNVGYKNYWKDYFAIDSQESTLTSEDDPSVCNRKLEGSSTGSGHHLDGKAQWHSFKCASIKNKQNNSNHHANVRFLIPTDCQIANVQSESLAEEGRDAGYPRLVEKDSDTSNESNHGDPGPDGTSKQNSKESQTPFDDDSRDIIALDGRAEMLLDIKEKSFAKHMGAKATSISKKTHLKALQDGDVRTTPVPPEENPPAKGLQPPGTTLSALPIEREKTEEEATDSSSSSREDDESGSRTLSSGACTAGSPPASKENDEYAMQPFGTFSSFAQDESDEAEEALDAEHSLEATAATTGVRSSEPSKSAAYRASGSPLLSFCSSEPESTVNDGDEFDSEQKTEPDAETTSTSSDWALNPTAQTMESSDFGSLTSDEALLSRFQLTNELAARPGDEAEVLKKDEGSAEPAGCWKDKPWEDESFVGKLQPAAIVAAADPETSGDEHCKGWKGREGIEEEPVDIGGALGDGDYSERNVVALSNPVPSSAPSAERNGLDFSQSEPSGLAGGSQEQSLLAAPSSDAQTGSVPSSVDVESSHPLLMKVMDDNKKLKELLKEVMKWNTFQASAMLALTERFEDIQNK